LSQGKNPKKKRFTGKGIGVGRKPNQGGKGVGVQTKTTGAEVVGGLKNRGKKKKAHSAKKKGPKNRGERWGVEAQGLGDGQ